MTRYWWRRCWKWALVSTLAISGAYASSGAATKAQIQPDATLPQNSIVTPQGSTSRIDGGTKAGNNLFHSFTQFSVPTGGTAYFNNALDVRNIFSRITGGGVSNIDGILQANGTANLFLLNPNGIIFGLNAQLNIGGSFVVTTANAIGFGSQGDFSATIPNNPSLLTVEPSVFLFNQSAAQPLNSIVNQGTLQVNPGNSLLLVGGNISPNSDMTGGILIDGTINGYLAAPGGRIEIGGLSAPGTIGLVSDQNNSGLMSLNFPKGVDRTDVSLANTAALDVRGDNGGSIAINARQLSISGGSVVLAGIAPNSGFIGAKAGDITIDATGVISVDTSSVIANQVSPGSIGNGGNISIIARTLSVNNGTQIDTATLGQGNAGNVSITASSSINLDGQSSNGPTTVGGSVAPGAVGNGGNVSITAPTLNVTNGAQIQAATSGQGNAGNVTITASDRLTLDGQGSNGPSAVGSPAEPGAVGNGGNVEISTGTLSVTNGAAITTSTGGQGNAGNVTITASDRINLDGQGRSGVPSAVGSSVEVGGVGIGGNISITAPIFSITNGATVTARSYGAGDAGDIANITARTLNLDNGSITTTSLSGNGGNIRNLQVQDLLLLRNHSQISTTAGTQQSGGGNGGNININAGFIVAVPIEDSDITANAFAGKGGNIQISAQGIFGITSQTSQIPISRITASSQLGINGTVQITTPGIDPSRGLVPVPVSPGAPDVPQNCQASARQGGSRFINSQLGGLPPNPQEALSSSTLWSDSRSPRQLQNHSSSMTSPPKEDTDAIVEAQGWVKGANRTVILIAQAPTVSSSTASQKLDISRHKCPMLPN